MSSSVSSDLCRGMTFALLALCLSTARAGAGGYYLEEELLRSAPGSEPTRDVLRTWIEGGNMRKEEAASGRVTIFREADKVVLVLDPKSKRYAKITREAMDALGRDAVTSFVGGEEDPAKWLEITGNKKRLGEWNASEVRILDRPFPGLTMTLWLSEDVPIEPAVRDRFAAAMFGEANPATRLLMAIRTLPGYPVEVRVAVRLSAGQILEMTQRLLKVTELATIPAERFAIPAGYVAASPP